jgi:hypothetical protein
MIFSSHIRRILIIIEYMGKQFHPIPGTRSSYSIRHLMDTDRVLSIPGIQETGFNRNSIEFLPTTRWSHYHTVRYIQVSKKRNYGNFCNFQEHINLQRSIFENLRGYRKFENFGNYQIFRNHGAFEASFPKFL